MSTPLDPDQWRDARRIVARALGSSLHCAIASVDPDGTPHVTPIGSLLLAREPGVGLYFDVFNAQLAKNVANSPRVSVLAVDSAPATWTAALTAGRFETAPGVRLGGIVGPRRAATADEIDGFHRRVAPLLDTPGGRTMWTNARHVRDIRFDTIKTVRIGAMTDRDGPSNSRPR